MWRHAFYVSVPEAFGLRLYVTSLTMPLQPLRFSLSTQLKPPNTQIIAVAGQSALKPLNRSRRRESALILCLGKQTRAPTHVGGYKIPGERGGRRPGEGARLIPTAKPKSPSPHFRKHP